MREMTAHSARSVEAGELTVLWLRRPATASGVGVALCFQEVNHERRTYEASGVNA